MTNSLPQPPQLLDENKRSILHKEIDLIQAIITRMAQNSFHMKAWCITLLAALISLTLDSNTYYTFASLLVIIGTFWFLDSYYLQLERIFRVLYTQTINRRTKENDWSALYSLNITNCKTQVSCVLRIMFSISELLYPILIILIIIGGIIKRIPLDLPSNQTASLEVNNTYQAHSSTNNSTCENSLNKHTK